MILRDHEVGGLAFLHMTENALTKPPFNFGYGKITNLLVLINNLNNQSKFYII
ncbi:hypothetical protein RhiirC2_764092, partial [Rhizophagus irregularis]